MFTKGDTVELALFTWEVSDVIKIARWFKSTAYIEIGGILFILKDEVERLKMARAPQGRKLSTASGGE